MEDREEKQVSLFKLVAEVSRRRMPKRNYTTYWRWARHGVRVGGNTVKLQTVNVAGRLYSSVEAVQRFSVECQRADANRLQLHRETPAKRPRAKKNAPKKRHPFKT